MTALRRTTIRRAVATTFTVLLIGCGGSSDDSGGPDDARSVSESSDPAGLEPAASDDLVEEEPMQFDTRPADSTPGPTTPPRTTDWHYVDLPGITGIITRGADPDEWTFHSAGILSETSLDESTVADFEAAIEPALRADGHTVVADRLSTYRRWYYGANVGGRERLLAWFSCNPPSDDDLQFIPFVLDGGDCYFEAAWDIADQTVVNLIINGG